VRKIIKQKALELGFCAVGFSKADFLEKEARALETWLNDGMHSSMSYMKNNPEKRIRSPETGSWRKIDHFSCL